MKRILFILIILLLFGCAQQPKEQQEKTEYENKTMTTEENNTKLITLKGEVLPTKEGAYVDNVVIIDPKIEKYVGKNVEVEGYAHEREDVTKKIGKDGQIIYLQAREGKYLEMYKIKSIKIIKI